MSDKEVILRIKKGEINHFAILVKKYTPVIYRFLFSKLKNKEDCEDLLQEIFFNFYKSLDGFDERRSILPYLFQITKNQLKMFYRKKKITLPLKEEIIVNDEYIDLLEDLFSNLEDIFLKLNEKEKKIFRLLSYGYKIKEISQKLKVKENTVKSIIRRGRIKLKN